MSRMRVALKTILRRFNRKLVFVPKGTVWGSDLDEDLRVLIKRPDPICLDVGANVGQTVVYLHNVFQRPHIYAFEPSPQTFELLKKMEHLPNLKIYNIAVGSESTTLNLNEYPHSDLNSVLDIVGYRSPSRVTPVSVTTIDAFTLAHSISTIDLLKSDTQGFDLEVLKGAMGAMRRGAIKNILIELNFRGLYKNQASVMDILGLLQELNYGLVDFYDKQRRSTNCIQWCNGLFTLQK